VLSSLRPSPNVKLVGPLYLLAGLAIVAPLAGLYALICSSAAQSDLGGCGPFLLLPLYGLGFAAIAVANYLAPDVMQLRLSGCLSFLFYMVVGLLSVVPPIVAYTAFPPKALKEAPEEIQRKSN